MKLNQVIAIKNGLASAATAKLTAAYHLFQKPAPLAGVSRVYTAYAEDGEVLPPETTLVQVKVTEVIRDLISDMAKEWDITLTNDSGNTQASADVVVDGAIIIKDAPVTYLLWLEKKLVDLTTFISKLPVLDPAETWHYDSNRSVYVTDPASTVRSLKKPSVLVRYEATKEHPAQTEVYNQDVPVGRWTTVKSSGAIPADYQKQLAERIAALTLAVKLAREEANSIEVQHLHIGENVLHWLFTLES